MELFKPLLSFGIFISIAYFFGALLIETRAVEDEHYIIPRTRKKLYILRAYSFFEYLILITLFFFIVIKGKQVNEFYKIAKWVVIVTFAIRFLMMIINTKKIHKWITKNRFTSHIGNLMIIGWLGLSFHLFSISSSNSEKLLSFAISVYTLLTVVRLRALLVESIFKILITIHTKEGKKYEKLHLLEESDDFFILSNAPNKNLMIPKSEVKQAELWIPDLIKKKEINNCDNEDYSNDRASIKDNN